MGVAGQEEIDVVAAGPRELIGAMGQRDAERPALPRRAAMLQVGRRQPGQLVARQDHRQAADLDLHVAPAQVAQPGTARSPAVSRAVSTRTSWLPRTK